MTQVNAPHSAVLGFHFPLGTCARWTGTCPPHGTVTQSLNGERSSGSERIGTGGKPPGQCLVPCPLPSPFSQSLWVTQVTLGLT